MTLRTDSDDYPRLLLQGLPLLDVRAPIEFSRGAFPGAVNLPLMNDIERQKVGTCYQQRGAAEALALGHRLVSGSVREARITAWVDFASTHPEGYLYCFRGGLRSQLVQQWLAEAGVVYPRILGGYKALRHFLLESLQTSLDACHWIVLGGWTGTGKTDLLSSLSAAIDLEHHANHRGSGFGKRATAQPAQIDFEHRLTIDLLRQRMAGRQSFVVEDEGPIIGSRSVPLTLFQRMQQAPMVWLEASIEERVERILRQYVVDLNLEFNALLGPDAGFEAFAERLRQSLASIGRRLGGLRTQALGSLMERALEDQRNGGDGGQHRAWIRALLQDYYDPMYTHQREQKADRIRFSGTAEAVSAYLNQRDRRPTSQTAG